MGAGESGALRQRIGRRQVTLAVVRPIIAAALLLTGYFLLPIAKESSANFIGLAVGALLLIAFCAWEIRHFVHSEYPVATAVEMLVAIAALYIVAFATTYYLFSEYADGSFNTHLTRIDALYFCLTVFTTTGFGDIAADSQAARVAVSIQMASTLILLGLGLRFLNVLVTARVRR
ncbi:potassium channel family protein [Gordonia sp. DT101]|uniref:potassium channel family protein n=1 Tax=Gordonia sp. DT101 TaxID=3416545 RepID=UPI003CE7CE06